MLSNKRMQRWSPITQDGCHRSKFPSQLPGSSPRGRSVLPPSAVARTPFSLVWSQAWPPLGATTYTLCLGATAMTMTPHCRVTPALVALQYTLTHQLCSVSLPPTGCQTSLLIERHTKLHLWCPGNPHISISTRIPPLASWVRRIWQLVGELYKFNNWYSKNFPLKVKTYN